MKPSVISIVHIAHAMKICCNCLMICHIAGMILSRGEEILIFLDFTLEIYNNASKLEPHDANGVAGVVQW